MKDEFRNLLIVAMLGLWVAMFFSTLKQLNELRSLQQKREQNTSLREINAMLVEVNKRLDSAIVTLKAMNET